MSFNEQLQALQQQYMEGLPAILDQVCTLAEALPVAGPNDEQLKSLSAVLHKLSGFWPVSAQRSGREPGPQAGSGYVCRSRL